MAGKVKSFKAGYIINASNHNPCQWIGSYYTETI